MKFLTGWRQDKANIDRCVAQIDKIQAQQQAHIGKQRQNFQLEQGDLLDLFAQLFRSISWQNSSSLSLLERCQFLADNRVMLV